MKNNLTKTENTTAISIFYWSMEKSPEFLLQVKARLADLFTHIDSVLCEQQAIVCPCSLIFLFIFPMNKTRKYDSK